MTIISGASRPENSLQAILQSHAFEVKSVRLGKLVIVRFTNPEIALQVVIDFWKTIDTSVINLETLKSLEGERRLTYLSQTFSGLENKILTHVEIHTNSADFVVFTNRKNEDYVFPSVVESWLIDNCFISMEQGGCLGSKNSAQL